MKLSICNRKKHWHLYHGLEKNKSEIELTLKPA